MTKTEWVRIGKIAAAHGLRGEVRVVPLTDFPERFETRGTRWLQRSPSHPPEAIELLGARYVPGKGQYIVQFAGIDDRDRAEALRGGVLLVPQSDRLPLERDEFHVSDLLDLTVVLQATGEKIGIVTDVIAGGNDLLQVRRLPTDGASEERPPKSPPLLIPFVKEIVPVVDLEAGILAIAPPPGLLDLNLSDRSPRSPSHERSPAPDSV